MIRFVVLKIPAMFIARFKAALASLPSQDVGYNEFAQCVRSERDVFFEFFTRVTNYAANHAAGAVHYDPRHLTTALLATRFPIEVLGAPEEPTRFTLLNSAWKFLQEIDVVLYTHNPKEDDTADDFLDSQTCVDYMRALNGLHNAWSALSECSVGF